MEFDRSFISEYISDMKEMMQEFKNEFGIDLDNRFKTSTMYQANYFPIQIYETPDQLELYILTFSIKDINDIDVIIKDSRNIYVKVPCPKIETSNNSHLIYSDFPKCFERNIVLLQPILADSINMYLKHDFLLITLLKETPNFDLPIEI